jgi:hypothetical protein
MAELATVFIAAAGRLLSAAAAFFSKPPGAYLGAALLAIGIVSGAHLLGYRAGRSDCEAAQVRAAAEAANFRQRLNAAVSARADERAAHNDEAGNRNRERVRYVTVHARTLSDGDAVCIPAVLADRMRVLE